MKINTNFDAELKKIENLNKNWLPWIGERYFDLPEDKRLVIVGESAYETEDININQPDYNRKIIEKGGMQEGDLWDTNKFISLMQKNLEKSLSVDPNDIDEKRYFWERVCYFNIIQRPLKSRMDKDRPKWQDFINGWDVFYQIIDILNPSYCLFNGVEASNHFYSSKAERFNYFSEQERPLKLDKINSCYPRKVILKKEKKKLKIIFIKHTSRAFSYGPWNNLINNEFADLSNSLIKNIRRSD